jgi:hypothetical protein
MRPPFKIMVIRNVTLCGFGDFVGLLKCWYLYTILRGDTFQNNVILIWHENLKCHITSLKSQILYIQDVSKPMSQTVSGYSPPPIKQKISYQHGSKSEHVPRYRLTFMCWYPFEHYISCSKCLPFAATHTLRRRIMDSLMRSSWPGQFLMASNVATMCSHNSSTLVTGVE